jgi:tryptophanyl-tRNA synthetase
MTKNAMKKALKLAELERKKKEKEEAAKAKQ